MMRRNRIVFAIFIGLAFTFIAGGSYILYWQYTGTLTMVRIDHCVRKPKSEVCYGLWFVGNQPVTGVVESATSDDIGGRMEAIVLGNRAIEPGLRLPLVFFSLGLLFVFFSWKWYRVEISGKVR